MRRRSGPTVASKIVDVQRCDVPPVWHITQQCITGDMPDGLFRGILVIMRECTSRSVKIFDTMVDSHERGNIKTSSVIAFVDFFFSKSKNRRTGEFPIT
jgi:hypothetical protein